MSIYQIAPLLTSFLLFLIGAFVFFSNRTSRTNILFSLFCLSLFVWLAFFTAMYFSTNQNQALFLARMGFIGIIFIPILAFHFIAEFTNIRMPKYFFPFLYSLSIPAFFISRTDLIYAGVRRYFWGFYPSAGPFYIVFLTAFVILFSSGVCLLFYSLLDKRKKYTPVKRNQIKYVLVGFAIGLSGIVDYVIKYGIEFYPFGYISALLFILLIAYAITKTRLMDIKVVISRTFSHFITIVIVVSVYTLMTIAYLSFNNNKLDWTYILMILFYGIIIGEYFDKLRQHIQTPIDRFFIKTGYDFPKVTREIASKFRQSLTHKDIMQNIYPILSETVDIKDIRFFFSSSESKDLIEWNAKSLEPIKNSIIKHNNTILLEAQKTNEVVTILKESKLGGKLAIPAIANNKVLALIIIGGKRSEEEFTEQDLSLIKSISEYVAIALEYIVKPYEEVQKQFEQSERRLLRAEKELYRSQRLASIGTLTAGVTHEIRNPLGIIRTGLDILPKKERDLEYLKNFREKYEKYVDRIEGIVERILGLAKEEKTVNEEQVDLNEVINNISAMLSIPDNVKIIKQLQELPKIKGVLHDLERVFINLCDNGIHAMPDGGTLTIKSTFEKEDNENPSKVVVTIKDTGIGIPKENQEKIFDPFFSSRHDGTGLGLSITFRITKEHGGNITFVSKEDEGTTFTLGFPSYQP